MAEAEFVEEVFDVNNDRLQTLILSKHLQLASGGKQTAVRDDNQVGGIIRSSPV